LDKMGQRIAKSKGASKTEAGEAAPQTTVNTVEGMGERSSEARSSSPTATGGSHQATAPSDSNFTNEPKAESRTFEFQIETKPQLQR
jgi:hypothetical protein